jgi:hypothetical protein
MADVVVLQRNPDGLGLEPMMGPLARPESVMSLPRSVAEVLSRHVRFEIECIDRMYLNVYVPGLQSVAGAVWFCRTHLGQPYASTALLEPISRRFVAAMLVFGLQVYRNSRHRFRTRVVTDGVTPACTSTTNTPRSSSTTSSAALYAPKPPSMTPATSTCTAGCVTCPL